MAQKPNFMNELRTALARFQNNGNGEPADTRDSADVSLLGKDRVVKTGTSTRYASVTSCDLITCQARNNRTALPSGEQIAGKRRESMDNEGQSGIGNHVPRPKENFFSNRGNKNTSLWNNSGRVSVGMINDSFGYVNQLADGLRPTGNTMTENPIRDSCCQYPERVTDGGVLKSGSVSDMVNGINAGEAKSLNGEGSSLGNPSGSFPETKSADTKSAGGKCTKQNAAKESCTHLFEELNVVLQRRKQSGSKVNILDIERMKTGKSIMYFGARPTKEENLSSIDLYGKCQNGNSSCGTGGPSETKGPLDQGGSCYSNGKFSGLEINSDLPTGHGNIVSRSIKNFEQISLASSTRQSDNRRTIGGSQTNNNSRSTCLHCNGDVGTAQKGHPEGAASRCQRSEVAVDECDGGVSQRVAASEIIRREMSPTVTASSTSRSRHGGNLSESLPLPDSVSDHSVSKSLRDLSHQKVIELKRELKMMGCDTADDDKHEDVCVQKGKPVHSHVENGSTVMRDATGINRRSANGMDKSMAPPPPPLPPVNSTSASTRENLAVSGEIVYKDAYLSSPSDGNFQEELVQMALKLQAKRRSIESLDCLASDETKSDDEQATSAASTGEEANKKSDNKTFDDSKPMESRQESNDGTADEKQHSEERMADKICDGEGRRFASNCAIDEEPLDSSSQAVRPLPWIHFAEEKDSNASSVPERNHLQDDVSNGQSEERSVSEVGNHPGTLISDLVNSIRCQVISSDDTESELTTPSERSSGLSDIMPPDIDGTSSSVPESTTKSVSSSLFPFQSALLMPQENHSNMRQMSASLASVMSVEASTAFTTFDDDDDEEEEEEDGDGDDHKDHGNGDEDDKSCCSKECEFRYPSYLSRSVENVAPEAVEGASPPIPNVHQDLPHNVSTDVEDGFATYPPPRTARNRTICAGADREIITSLMITHSGDRIPPDGAEVQAGQYNSRLNSNVTVPEPTSFHQHGNNVGKHFLSPNNRHLTTAEVHRNASLLRSAVPSISEPAIDLDPDGSSKRQALPRHVSLDKEAQRYMLYYTWSSNSVQQRQPKCNSLRRVKHDALEDDSDSSGAMMDHRLLTDTIPDKRSPIWPDSRTDDKSKTKLGSEVGLLYKRKLSTHLINADLAHASGTSYGRNPSADDGSDGDTESLYQDYDKYEQALIRSIKPRDLCRVNENLNSLYRQQLEGGGVATLIDTPTSFLHRLTCCFICQSHHSLVSTYVDTNRARRASTTQRRNSSTRPNRPHKTNQHKQNLSRRHLVRDDSPPGTPITQNIIDTAALVTAFGQGLQTAEKGQPAKFMIDTKGKRGNIEVHVKGTHTISQVQLDPVGTQFQASYVPMETGLFQVSILWNGQQISGSPFHVNVTEPFDINSITPVGGWHAVLDSEGKMFLKSRVINKIDFDTSRASHCTLTATVESPTREVVPVTVEKMMNGTQTTISFVPRTPGLYQIRIFCNDVCLPRCPIPALAPDPVDHEKVVLTGLGLQEAIVNQQAEFIIDGSEAGPGEPNVKLTGVKKDIPVHLEQIGANKYKASYVPVIPGAYLLSITWNNRLVRGSPFKVNIKSGANASKVSVNTDGFRQSVFGKEIKAIIDTRRAGPGELTAHCMGPNKVAYCELLDHRDGTFTLNIRPQEPGKHILQVKYGGEHVPGSPFLLKVAGPPDASKVRVSGPGVESGILANFQSRFIVETRGAGAGQLTVRIRGPKGAFRVEMQRESQKDRTILCRYDPTEVGTYIIHVKWSGEHVPGSPFTIHIFDTINELTEYQVNNQNRVQRPYMDSDQWSENL